MFCDMGGHIYYDVMSQYIRVIYCDMGAMYGDLSQHKAKATGLAPLLENLKDFQLQM